MLTRSHGGGNGGWSAQIGLWRQITQRPRCGTAAMHAHGRARGAAAEGASSRNPQDGTWRGDGGGRDVARLPCTITPAVVLEAQRRGELRAGIPAMARSVATAASERARSGCPTRALSSCHLRLSQCRCKVRICQAAATVEIWRGCSSQPACPLVMYEAVAAAAAHCWRYRLPAPSSKASHWGRVVMAVGVLSPSASRWPSWWVRAMEGIRRVPAPQFAHSLGDGEITKPS